MPLLNLIRIDENNLAEYEGYIEPDAAETLKRYYHRGAVVTDEDTLPLGYAIWEYRHMEDEEPVQAQLIHFFAEDDEAAAALLSSFAESVKNEGAVKTVFRLPVMDMERYKGCFERAGYTINVANGEYLRLTIKDFLSLPFVSEWKGESVKALDRINLRSFRQEIRRFVSAGKRDVLSEVRYLPFTWYDLDISCFSGSDGKPDGFLLVHETPSGILRAELFGTADRTPGAVVSLLGFSVKESMKKYPEDTEVIVRKNDPFSVKLTNYLFPEKIPEEVFYGELGNG